jgi:hypothetical protein
MLSRFVLPCAMLLGLAACTSQTMADGSTRLSISPANLFAQPGSAFGQPGAVQPAVVGGGGLPFDDVLVHRVAARFVSDWRQGGMSGLVTDLRNCYASAERGGPNRSALRDCIALDTAAKNRERADEQRFGRPMTDYLSDNAELARFNRYSPQVFNSKAEAFDFIRNNGRAVYFQGATMLGES